MTSLSSSGSLSSLFSRDALQNPVVVAGMVLLALALFAVASSAGKLLTAVLFDPEPKVLSVQRSSSGGAFDPNAINERNFFGLASDKPTVALETLPETKLELTLRGAFAAQSDDEAGAIIEDDKSISLHYSVGDEVPGNATLNAVYPDRVVLSRNGLLETLYFPEQDSASAGVGTRVNTNARPNTTAPAQGAADDEAVKRREAIRKRIRELRGR